MEPPPQEYRTIRGPVKKPPQIAQNGCFLGFLGVYRPFEGGLILVFGPTAHESHASASHQQPTRDPKEPA